MQQPINPLNYLAFAILGAALLWAVKVVYDGRNGSADDFVRRLLLLFGWILFFAGSIGVVIGLTGPLSWLPMFGVIAAGFGYVKYMAAERRSLLWALAIAAERGIPLDEAARAFADERSVVLGPRTARLAELLEAGAPLPQALAIARHPLPTDALLAARLGAETGQIAKALQMAIQFGNQFEMALRSLLAKYFYLLLVLFVGSMVVMFVMVRIVPVMTQLMSDFDLELPLVTRYLVAASDWLVIYWPFFIPVFIAILFLCLIGVSFYVGVSRYELPLLNRVWRRCDTSLILKSMALTVGQGRSIASTVFMLSKQYPKKSAGELLAKASRAINDGEHWCDAMQSAGLLRAADAGVLKAAERVGNLAWALEEMSDSSLRRFALRVQLVINTLFPLVVLGFGVTVMLIAVGALLPLISMIKGLA